MSFKRSIIKSNAEKKSKECQKGKLVSVQLTASTGFNNFI